MQNTQTYSDLDTEQKKKKQSNSSAFFPPYFRGVFFFQSICYIVQVNALICSSHSVSKQPMML